MKANHLHVIGLLLLERAPPILRQFLACRSVGYCSLRCCTKTTRFSWFSAPSEEGASPGWIFRPVQGFTDESPPSAKTFTNHAFPAILLVSAAIHDSPEPRSRSFKITAKTPRLPAFRFLTGTSRGQCRNGHFDLGLRFSTPLSLRPLFDVLNGSFFIGRIR